MAIRNLRKKLKAEIKPSLSQDERTWAEKQIQELTDSHVAQVDRIVNDKIAII